MGLVQSDTRETVHIRNPLVVGVTLCGLSTTAEDVALASYYEDATCRTCREEAGVDAY